VGAPVRMSGDDTRDDCQAQENRGSVTGSNRIKAMLRIEATGRRGAPGG
jgi:hypothetical protein